MEDRILIADDDPSILMLISDVLTDAGMQVRTVASGEEALRAVGEETFSLIILDIMMKGISGLEVCAAIRDKVSCPILFLSAKDSAHDIIEGLGLGADDYLTKPFAIDELVARIKAHLRRQARLGENTTGGDVLRIGFRAQHQYAVVLFHVQRIQIRLQILLGVKIAHAQAVTLDGGTLIQRLGKRHEKRRIADDEAMLFQHQK